MVASGDWLTPRLNGFKYFEKPPLQYWATAAAFTAVRRAPSGPPGCGARCTGFARRAAGVFTGRRLSRRRRRRCLPPRCSPAAPCMRLIGAASTRSTWACRVPLALRYSPSSSPSSTTRRSARAARWMLAAWAALALAVLSKGLIGAGAAVRRGRALHPVAARLSACCGACTSSPARRCSSLIAAPWFVAVIAANPEFARFFFVHEHFERFLTTAARPLPGPAWYFVPVLLARHLALVAARSPRRAVAGRARCGACAFQADALPARLVRSWCSCSFRVSGSKLPSYILPMFPALALLVGAHLAGASRRAARSRRRCLAALLGHRAARAACAGMRRHAGCARPQHLQRVPALAAGGRRRARRSLGARGRLRSPGAAGACASIVALAAGGLACTQLALLGHETPVAAILRVPCRDQKRAPGCRRHARFYTVDTYDHTLPFYLRRTVTMVA